MTAAERLKLISPEEYLAGEFDSQAKHEFIAGVVYAMAGASNTHNTISVNLVGTLHNRLQSTVCQPFNSDTKVRVQLPTHVRFYYPDAMVVCHSNPGEDSFQDHPVVIAEVLSAKTRRVDEGEKREAYLTIPSLKVYLLIEQEEPLVLAWRRTDEGFVREVYSGLDAVIPLTEINTDLPLSQVYDRVVFSPESTDD